MNNSVNKIDFETIIKNKELYSKQFSEGNIDLEKCLLKLWHNNIKTAGCCIGHGKEKPYISFELINSDLVYNIINNISKDNIRISFTCQNTNKKIISIKSIDYNDLSIFKKIYDSVDLTNKKEYFNVEIDKCKKWDEGYYNSVYYFSDKVKRIIVTDNKEEIEELKRNYKYDILNENKGLYQFYL